MGVRGGGTRLLPHFPIVTIGSQLFVRGLVQVFMNLESLPGSLTRVRALNRLHIQILEFPNCSLGGREPWVAQLSSTMMYFPVTN